MLRHNWNLNPVEAVKLQEKLAGMVRAEPLDGPVESVAGADCAFPDSDTIAAAAILCDAETMEIICSAEVVRKCRFPYIPGLLSFREAPAVISAVRKLMKKTSRPDLLMCDGQGMAHPRGLGIASHVGLVLDIPTTGVAKSRLCGTHAEPGRRRGCSRPLRFGGRVVGSVLRTRDNVKPLYVSAGHRITLEESVEWVLRCGRGVRLPEPTRRAHAAVGRIKRP